MKKKMDLNLKNLDPEIKQIFDDCRAQLQKIQEEKEQAIDEFLEEHTEDKIIRQKIITKKFKALDPEE